MKRKYALILLLLLSSAFLLKGQTEQDKRWNNWRNQQNPDSTRFESLKQIISPGFLNNEADSAIILSNLLLEFAKSRQNKGYQAEATMLLGQANSVLSKFFEAKIYFESAIKQFYLLKNYKKAIDVKLLLADCAIKIGEYSKALKCIEESLKYHEQVNDTLGLAWDSYGIARVYYYKDDFQNVIKYANASLRVFKKLNNQEGKARILNALGLAHFGKGDLKTALAYLDSSYAINLKTKDEVLLSYNMNNIGRIYINLERYDDALELFYKSLEIKQRTGDKWAEAETLLRIGQAYQLKKNYQEATKWCLKSLQLAQEIGEIKWRSEIYKCLYESNLGLKNYPKAIEYNEHFLAIQDSLQKDKAEQLLQKMEYQKQILADSMVNLDNERAMQMVHAEEIHKEEIIKNISYTVGILILILAVGLWSRLNYIRKSKSIIEKERDRSDELLLNILPSEIAEELKLHGKADARDFEMVSILFTDFKGFTEHSAKLSAADLVNEINRCFEAFDRIITKFRIEKIKTIGDAYMAAGGLPVPTADSTKRTVLAALEMQAFIGKRKAKMDAAGKPAFEMRVGIHTGPVVAGIVGIKKFQYDIWGDTVNTASRMESNGKVGKVNISQDTYDLLKDDADFVFESRGKIEAKGKGEMEMWFVSKT